MQHSCACASLLSTLLSSVTSKQSVLKGASPSFFRPGELLESVSEALLSHISDIEIADPALSAASAAELAIVAPVEANMAYFDERLVESGPSAEDAIRSSASEAAAGKDSGGVSGSTAAARRLSALTGAALPSSLTSGSGKDNRRSSACSTEVPSNESSWSSEWGDLASRSSCHSSTVDVGESAARENELPLDLATVAEESARRAEVTMFPSQVLETLCLEPECLVIGLVLLERVLLQPEALLRLTPHTWRLTTLVALLLAAKTWYDEAVFSVDFCERLGLCSLPRINSLERHMLRLLEYQTAVPMALYARYCFALQEILSPMPQAGSSRPGHRRSGSWSAGQ